MLFIKITIVNFKNSNFTVTVDYFVIYFELGVILKILQLHSHTDRKIFFTNNYIFLSGGNWSNNKLYIIACLAYHKVAGLIRSGEGFCNL